MRNTHIYVISEGLLFEGVKLPRAWAWLPVGAAPKPSSPASREDIAKDRVLKLLEKTPLSKDTKKQCRLILRDLKGSQVLELEKQLRRKL